jgi:hypothetical protein
VNLAELAGSWAQLGRVNLAGGHADLVETVITLEEQLQTFFASMDVLTADVTSLRKGCPKNACFTYFNVLCVLLVCKNNPSFWKAMRSQIPLLNPVL